MRYKSAREAKRIGIDERGGARLEYREGSRESLERHGAKKNFRQVKYLDY